MTRDAAVWFLRLYPRAWRERYGDEFLLLLEHEKARPRLAADVVAGAFDAWMRAAAGIRTPALAEGPPLVFDDGGDTWSVRHLRVLALSVGVAFVSYGGAGVAQLVSGPVWWLAAINQPIAILGVLYGGHAIWRLRRFKPVTRAVGAVLFGAPFVLLAMLMQTVQ